VIQEEAFMTKLKGKTAVVTGATGGIGEATAKLFLELGANVMLVGRSEEKLKATLNRFASHTGVAASLADAGDEEAMAAAIAATAKAFGGVDIVVANAGTEGTVRLVDAISMTEFEQVLRTNVLGVWLCLKYCVEPMKKRGGGSMIVMASIAGLVGYPGLIPYIASKHAVCGMVKSAALELGEFNIRVNAIAPGMIDNRMLHSLLSQVSPENPKAVRDTSLERIAMKRLGTNEEIAQLAAFLASDDSSYCNGGIFTADGGYTAA
jgi:NAD(P)-dependent dehydrogenase (short-subunit alcohol dehydrogenase family)